VRYETLPTAYNDALNAGDPEAAKLFDTTRDAETKHFNLDSDVTRNRSKMKEAFGNPGSSSGWPPACHAGGFCRSIRKATSRLWASRAMIGAPALCLVRTT